MRLSDLENGFCFRRRPCRNLSEGAAIDGPPLQHGSRLTDRAVGRLQSDATMHSEAKAASSCMTRSACSRSCQATCPARRSPWAARHVAEVVEAAPERSKRPQWLAGCPLPGLSDLSGLIQLPRAASPRATASVDPAQCILSRFG